MSFRETVQVSACPSEGSLTGNIDVAAVHQQVHSRYKTSVESDAKTALERFINCITHRASGGGGPATALGSLEAVFANKQNAERAANLVARGLAFFQYATDAHLCQCESLVFAVVHDLKIAVPLEPIIFTPDSDDSIKCVINGTAIARQLATRVDLSLDVNVEASDRLSRVFANPCRESVDEEEHLNELETTKYMILSDILWHAHSHLRLYAKGVTAYVESLANHTPFAAVDVNFRNPIVNEFRFAVEYADKALRTLTVIG